MCRRFSLLAIFFVSLVPISAKSDEPLPKRIDALVAAKADGPVAPLSSDAEFLRRVYLDFAGRIPSVAEARRFLNDKSPDKRTKLIDQLLAGPDYPVRMQEMFNIMLMERLGEHESWSKYLRDSFAKNKPWNEMASEILAASKKENDAEGAAFFMSKRLENYGQNPVDYPALTGDIGRLFLGKNFRCAQCHDHLFIGDYLQRDFQGLFAFVKNVSLQRGDKPGVMERPTTEKIEFSSVFVGEPNKTGPRIPGMKEIAIPEFKKGEEYAVKPDRKKRTPGVLKFSTLEELAKHLPTPQNQAFNQNIANRLWFVLMGRGLVHPLDLSHSRNPPSHPELLDLLAKEFVAHKYDIKWMLRELALTETYQRSSKLPEGVKKVDPQKFRTAMERRISAEQLLRSMLEATGEKYVKDGATFASRKALFLKAFADPPREPTEEVNPTLKAALFLLNNDTVLSWLESKPGNLQDRLAKLKGANAVAEELYLSILTRTPTDTERKTVADYLAKRADRKTAALRNLSWALLASTEFCVNH